MQKPVAVLVTMSCTHSGRGDPIPGKEVRRRIQEARRILDDFAPEASTYGYQDEDYGWLAPLDANAFRTACERLGADPESEIGEGIEIPSSICAWVDALDQDFEESMTGEPVQRDYMFEDWYDNYGGAG